jgi:hypothetical protein
MFYVTRIFKVIINAQGWLVSVERFFSQVQLNMPPETKTNCESKKHLSVSEKLAIYNSHKEFNALNF